MRVVTSAEEKQLLNLEAEIKRLNLEKAKLVGEVNKEIQALSDARGEQIKIERKCKAMLEEAQKEAEKIISQAKKIEDSASSKSNEIDNKYAMLDEEVKKAKALIESNRSLEKALDSEITDYKARIKKFNEVAEVIKKTLEG